MAATTKHTPAPWAEDINGVLRGANGNRVADLDRNERVSERRYDEIMGDRRIQIAAPDLLEELQKARGAVFLLMGLLGASEAEKAEACAPYDAALAKARGEG